MNWLDIARSMAVATGRPLWFTLAVIELAMRGKAGLLLKHFHVDTTGTDNTDEAALAARLSEAFGTAARGAAR